MVWQGKKGKRCSKFKEQLEPSVICLARDSSQSSPECQGEEKGGGRQAG